MTYNTQFVRLLTCAALLSCQVSFAQNRPYTTLNGHSHNDYEQPVPFYAAYQQQLGSIEADVFLVDGTLFVSHTRKDITPAATLEALYLQPIQHTLEKNSGYAYPKKSTEVLQLLIDIKTAAQPTLQALVKVLEKYPVIIHNPYVKIVISGNHPPLDTWDKYPAYLLFDGKKGVIYNATQSKRIPMVSADLQTFSRWNGKGVIVEEGRKLIERWIDSAHTAGKKVRFWGTADNVNTWRTLMHFGADYIGTDHPAQLSTFLQSQQASSFHGDSSLVHAIYRAKYVNNDGQGKVKNVILLIGDGMGLTQIYSGFTANRRKLNLTQFKNIGFSITASSDSYITDSAAGGTAMATGEKTNNRYIAVDATGVKLNAIPKLLAPTRKSSGLISVGDITDATPAAFYGHAKDRSESEQIADAFLGSNVDIMIGAGEKHFTKRKDGRNLAGKIEQAGFTFTTDVNALNTLQTGKFLLINDTIGASMLNGRGGILKAALQKTMTTLAKNPAGFFIMAEGAQIDYGGHANQLPYVVTEMLDFDDAIAAAMEFADKDGETLVIVTADHETGGLSLLDGDLEKGTVFGHFSTNDHTSVMVPVFAYGPRSMDFRGVYENTEIFKKIMAILKGH
ncbi:alkaline phosphatase [Chitinophaga skermanii]|uniref:Alkaline phosphatase n=1 Tax=Chitinophaga skermanii TaxID=331697 RepID=A0A327RAY2_9BACT|nr:alkaline phosphatase [Chitinophaga skermanii]RAJ11087.1 alkaline phosphatase [Chitinophaga skermanii]